MLTRIIGFSVKNPLVIGLLTLLMVAWGIYSFTKLPIDAVPDVTNNQVQVITTSPSLAPQEIEQFITFPVEIAMSNIQGVQEMRSISRFGLSVVTIVFKDNINTYLARQLVSEQIQMAQDQIPPGYGKPEMMPITTGLGEIFQYVIEPLPGFENRYSLMEIRSIQDWIVKRQLSGIPGIVEISSFGGQLKQYEVAINPQTLVGMDLTITEIFDALERNNQNTGGSYIEKGPYSFYIRSEGIVKNLEDIEAIVVKTINGTPLLIRDVAQVKLGSPPRFGAMTKDGKGEAVGGITLMLKGANSHKVIQRVKKRITKVQEMLPKGLIIHPYLDRANLISRTINTVSTNLIEGGLIVIFVLVLLLGNLRAGFIVASVIPLSMLFAFSLMHFFGVSANLMSLGALDFGLIVDGAVIIVEGIIHQIHKQYGGHKLQQEQLQKTITETGSRIGKSAIFGVSIILIVYLPIMVFSGIEGKMFKPMAQTVMFALLGALILSFTYVPMMSSLILGGKATASLKVADKIVDFLNKSHQPVLHYALKQKRLVLWLVAILLASSAFLFYGMGGEFIPTLEEGDLAVQMTISPGSSLTQSIKTSSEAEKILLKQFPEVKEVISKIGTAEVPTDPMAVEDADIMIILKDKKYWTSASTREQLTAKMKKALSVLAGTSFEFTQPIQLRFNELMTGSKSDVAVKIFGENMDTLFLLGQKAASYIRTIPGANDVRVEQVVGLPQMVVRYKRDQLAQYGLNIMDINRIIRTAFAGESTGMVFEDEKRYDLVVRLDKPYRKNIHTLERLRINNPSEELILLNQVAEITTETGPMQISREGTQRRIVIGINLRNRDVESLVSQINDTLTSGMKLPPGYFITYGGQFENLQAAKRSSVIAVPIALGLILILLYFAFDSLKQSLMIFSAIPLAAIGGIWALWFRGMPFSISAGVGFIALFGVAVLNGIVLISYFNQLERNGMNDIIQRVKEGTRIRLRPVIMTASVAALGFFPMALSTAAGAEVQKPLATVVIGGLISATFLTLVILPVIYVLFNSSHSQIKSPKGNVLPMVILLGAMLFPSQGAGQSKPEPLTLEKAIQQCLEKQVWLKNASLQLEKAKAVKSNALQLTPTQFTWETGEINSQKKDYHFSITQDFQLPWVYSAKIKENKNLQGYYQTQLHLITKKITHKVSLAWYHWIITLEKEKILQRQDSLYHRLSAAADCLYQTGEINSLNRLMVEAKSLEIANMLANCVEDRLIAQLELQKLMLTTTHFYSPKNPILKAHININPDESPQTPKIQELNSLVQLQKSALTNQKMKLLPQFTVGYFNQSIDKQKGFYGWLVGVKVPISLLWQGSIVKASRIQLAIQQNQLDAERISTPQKISQLKKGIEQHQRSLKYYQDAALPKANLILKHADHSFQLGEISYIELLQASSQAFNIQLEYLNTLSKYNKKVILMNYLITP